MSLEEIQVDSRMMFYKFVAFILLQVSELQIAQRLQEDILYLYRPGRLFSPVSHCYTFNSSLIAQLAKNLPAVQETWVRFLGWEDPLGERNGNSFQYSCLENPMDRGAWQVTVHGVASVRQD